MKKESNLTRKKSFNIDDKQGAIFNSRFLFATLLMILLSVSAVLALTVSMLSPGDSMDWGNTFMNLNASTDFNANCTYNLTDGTNEVKGTLGTNDTTDLHNESEIDISSLDEGVFDINVLCYNSSDGVLYVNNAWTGTKDTSGVDVLSWNQPEDGWTIQNGSVVMINITVNKSDTSNLNTSKMDVFDVSDCGGTILGGVTDYTAGPDGVTYVNATWDVPSAVNVGCNIVANLSTGSPQDIYNQSTITVDVHPACGDTISGSFTMQADVKGCDSDGFIIDTSGVTLDCDNHEISGPGTGGSTNGVYISPGLVGVTVKNCNINNFANGVTVEKTEASNFHDRDHVIQNNTFHTVAKGVKLKGRATYFLQNITVENNTILNTTLGGTAIYNDNTGLINGSVIRGNSIYDATYGIATLKNGGHQIYDNIINNTLGYGIKIEFGSYGDAFTGNIHDNIIDTATDGTYGTGIFIFNGGPSYNGKVINVYNNTIINCNAFGMNVSAATSLNIWHNNIYDNTLQLSSDAAINLSEGSQGNYWGRTSCPYFVANTDTDRADAVDSYPYNETDGWDSHGPAVCVSCEKQVSNDLTLSADLVCSGDDFALNITTNNVVVDCDGNGIFGDDTTDSVGIEIAPGVTGVEIQNCLIANFTEGIYMESGQNLVNSTTVENTTTALTLETGSDNTVIRQSEFINSGTGILLLDLTVGGNGLNITQNTITDNGVGVDVQNVDGSGTPVQMWYNDIHTNTVDLKGDGMDSNAFAVNYCNMGTGDCYGNYWGITDHCPYFRDQNTNETFENGGYRDTDAYGSSRVGQSLTDSPGCTVCGDSIDWDEVLEDNVYNSTGGDTCYGDFAVELTQDNAMLDCDGYEIKGTAGNVGVAIVNVTATNVTVKNCVISGYISGTSAAINISGGSDRTIYNNTLNNNAYGIRKADASGLSYNYNISENTITNSGTHAIYLIYVSELELRNNYINGAGSTGLYLSNSGNASVIGNRVNDTDSGMNIDDDEGFYIIEDNDFNSSSVGIRAFNCWEPQNITNNNFYNNNYGIYYLGIQTIASNKLIWFNNIVNSATNGISAPGTMEVSNGTHGNFWGNESCPLFVPGVHSNSTDVIDSHPYNATDGWDTYSEPAPPCESVQINYYEDDYGNTSMYLGRGDSMQIPEYIELFVNITNSSEAIVNISHGGVCIGLTEPATMIHDIPEDDFNFTCNINKTLLSEGEVNFTATAYIASALSVTDEANFTIYADYTRPDVVFAWRNVTNQTGSPEKIPEPHDLLGNPDFFYSPVDNMIYVSVNATDNSEIWYVEAFFNGSEMNDNLDNQCAGYFNLTYNGTTERWGMNCSLGTFDENNLDPDDPESPVMSANVEITAYDRAENANNMYNLSYDAVCVDSVACACNPNWMLNGQDCGSVFTPILIHDMGAPEINDTCEQFGTATTDFNNEFNFTAIDFTVELEINLSCMEGDSSLPNDFLSFYKINFTGLDFEDQNTVNKISNLDESIEVTIPASGDYGDARIYVNSTYFEELNESATIGLYRLPFQQEPEIQGDPGAAGGVSVLEWVTYDDADMQQTVGNLTFSVNGFSGYNVSDTVKPIITFIAPVPNASKAAGPEVFVNFTVNGTGTQVSNVTMVVDGVYNLAMNEMGCYNETGSELMVCAFNTTAIADGNHQFVVNAADYGGSAPGNQNSTTWNFTSDGSAPVITDSGRNVTGGSGTVDVRLNVTVTDLTNVSSVVFTNGTDVPATEREPGVWEVNTTPNTLGCGTGTCVVMVNATDYWGNKNYTNVGLTLAVDSSAPTVVVTAANASLATRNVTVMQDVNLTVTATDVGTAGTYNVTVTSGTGVHNLVNVGGDVWNFVGNPNFLACGANVICNLTFNATDNYGNSNTSVVHQIYVDTVAPAVTNLYVNVTEAKSTDYIWINATVTDASELPYGYVKAYTQSMAYFPVAGQWSSSGTVSTGFGCTIEGPCAITINASDEPGNVNDTETVSLIVDDTAPIVAFVFNSTNLSKSTDLVNLNVTVTEINTNQSVLANNVSMTQVPGTNVWSVEGTTPAAMGLTEGTNTITYTATDGAGNSGTATSSFTVDNTAPSVSSGTVNVSKSKIGNAVMIRVGVTDVNGVASVTVGGRVMTDMGSNLWEINETGTNLGCSANSVCPLTFVATDTSGNVNNTENVSYETDDTIQTVPSDFTTSKTSSSGTASSSSFTEDVKCEVKYGTNESSMGSTATSSLFSSTGAVTISGLSASTTYYYNVTQCWDEAGNIDTTEQGPFNFTTSATHTGGGGGGGGSSGSYSTTYNSGDLTNSQGEWSLRRGDGVKFKHDMEEHFIRMISVTDSYAEFEVMSDSQEYKLYKGQSADVDLNGDMKTDLVITLTDILAYRAKLKVVSKAESYLDRITLLPPAKPTRAVAEEPAAEEGVAEEVAETEIAPEEPVAEPAPAQTTAPETSTKTVEKNGNSGLIAILVVVLLAVALGIGLYVKKRQKYNF